MVYGKDGTMNMKWVGAAMIIATCMSIGVKMASSYLREEQQLEQLLQSLNYIKCELQYKLAPLSALFYQCASLSKGPLRAFYLNLCSELDSQVYPDAVCCFHAALNKSAELSNCTVKILKQLGATLGCFDLDGQLSGIDEAIESCQAELKLLTSSKSVRIRNYQTLSLCAGAALVILFI